MLLYCTSGVQHQALPLCIVSYQGMNGHCDVQVTALANDGCKAVAQTMRQRLLEHFAAAASARGGLVDL